MRRYIFGTLNLKAVLNTVRAEYKTWSEDDLEYAELWYRRFLWLNYRRKRGGIYGISDKADKVWHAHILYTESYREASEKILGRRNAYIEHRPLRGALSSADMKRLAQSDAIYEQEFRQPPPPDDNHPCCVPQQPQPRPPK
jgi:hypothetical protein